MITHKLFHLRAFSFLRKSYTEALFREILFYISTPMERLVSNTVQWRASSPPPTTTAFINGTTSKAQQMHRQLFIITFGYFGTSLFNHAFSDFYSGQHISGGFVAK